MQEIVTMMGGNYREKNNVIEIEFPTYKAKYTIGKRSYMVNGIKIQQMHQYCTLGALQNERHILNLRIKRYFVENGSVYFPLALLDCMRRIDMLWG